MRKFDCNSCLSVSEFGTAIIGALLLLVQMSWWMSTFWFRTAPYYSVGANEYVSHADCLLECYQCYFGAAEWLFLILVIIAFSDEIRCAWTAGRHDDLSLTFSNQLSECEYGYREFIIVWIVYIVFFQDCFAIEFIFTNTARPIISGRLARHLSIVITGRISIRYFNRFLVDLQFTLWLIAKSASV